MSRERDVSCGKRGGGEEETSGAPRNSGGLRDLILPAALAHARGPRHGGWDPVVGWVRRSRHSRGGKSKRGRRPPPTDFFFLVLLVLVLRAVLQMHHLAPAFGTFLWKKN